MPVNAPAPSRGFLLGSILGIPVRIDPSWFFIFLLITWSLSQGYFPSTTPGEPVWHYWAAGILGSLLFSLVGGVVCYQLVRRALEAIARRRERRRGGTGSTPDRAP